MYQVLLGVKGAEVDCSVSWESVRLNRKSEVETGSLEYSRGGRNSWCSGAMLRYYLVF